MAKHLFFSFLLLCSVLTASAQSVAITDLQIETNSKDKSIELSVFYSGELKKRTRLKVFVRDNGQIVYYLLGKNAEQPRSPLRLNFNLKKDTELHNAQNENKAFEMEVKLGKYDTKVKRFSFRD